MAQRRMFSNRIANSAKFLQMPVESQLLYFHFILRADDDGVVESYPVIRLLGISPDAFKVLVSRGFVQILNEDQVVIINDWLEHNVIRSDRKVDSIYKNLIPPSVKTITPTPRTDVEDNSKRLGGQSTDGIGKVRLGKVIDSNTTPNKQFETFWKEYPKKVNKQKSLLNWQKLNPDEELVGAILQNIKTRKEQTDWVKDNCRFVVYPERFIKDRRWEDEITINKVGGLDLRTK